VKIACQENRVPGGSFQERLDNLARYGYEGVELLYTDFPARLPEVKQALRNSPVKASTLCTSGMHDLLDVTQEDRKARMQRFVEMLQVAGELGLVGVIAVPVRGPRPIFPDLSPYKTGEELERELYVELLREAGEHAGRAGTQILIEPLNRYETHLVRSLAHGVALCEAVAHPNVKLMGDFFHMNLEEDDIAASIRAAAKYLAHIHLADSNRKQPGKGHTDFRPGFQALKEIGFQGFMALECAIEGDAEQAHPACVQYLKLCMA